MFVLLVTAGSASAANSLSLSTNANPSDATGVTVTATGTTGSSDYQLSVHDHAGGRTCGADPSSDTGDAIDPDGASPLDPTFSVSSSAPVQLLPRHYLLCAWVVDLNTSNVVAHAQLSLTVAAADTMTLVFTPHPAQGRTFNVVATGASYDQAALVDATYKPAAGGTCAASFAGDHGKHVDPGENSGATGTGHYDVSMSAPLILGPGTYLFCGWMYDQGTNRTITTTRATVSVPALHATMQLHAPSVVSGGGYTVHLDVTLPSGVPVTAVVDEMASSSGGCPARPHGHEVLRQDIEVHNGSSGTVHLKASDTNLQGRGAQLQCAWLLDGWSVNVNPEPVVAGPVSARVAVAHGGVFKGKTSQGFKIGIAVSAFNKQILGAQFKERLHCNGSVLLYTETLNGLIFGVVRPGAGGRFTIRQHGDGRSTVLHGRIKGKKITGSFVDKGRSSAFTFGRGQVRQCSTGTVHFTAHK